MEGYITPISLFYKNLGRACGAGFLIMINYIFNQMYYLQEYGDFTWRVSDCEELVGHQIEHLGRNATNYFMY